MERRSNERALPIPEESPRSLVLRASGSRSPAPRGKDSEHPREILALPRRLRGGRLAGRGVARERPEVGVLLRRRLRAVEPRVGMAGDARRLMDGNLGVELDEGISKRR